MTQSELKELKAIGAELGAAKAENEAMRILLRESYSELLVMKTEVGFRGKTLELIDRIDAFLSRQPEPTDTYTAVDMATAAAQGFRDGQAAVEPAPAQDDQYPPCDYCGVIPDHHPWHGSGMFNGEDSPHIHACNDCRHLLPTRPAQTEQQSVAVVPEEWKAGFKLHEIHKALDCGLPAPKYWAETCDGEPHVHTKLWSGLPGCGSFHSSRFWPLYGVSMLAFPIAQTAPSVCMGCVDLSSHVRELQHKMDYYKAQTAPLPEQSGLVTALEYYANGDHLLLADPDEWDTCSGEPANFLHDEAGTASVEDGSIAKVALEAYRAALSAQGQSNGDS